MPTSRAVINRVLLPPISLALAAGVSLGLAMPPQQQTADRRLPDVALSDLNPDVEVRDVASHFSLDVELVRIPVIVETDGGRFVSDLEASAFRVVDGTNPEAPVGELISEDEPTSIAILLDASDTVMDDQALLRTMVERILASLREDDEVMIIQFGSEARFLSDFSSSLEEIQAALEDYTVGGERALYDGLALGLIQMRTARHDKKSLVVLTAGDDTASETPEDQIRLAAQREGVAINAILLGQGLERWRPTGDNDSPAASEAARTVAVAMVEDGASMPDAEPKPSFVLQELAHTTGGLVAVRPGVESRIGGFEAWLTLACEDLASYMSHQYLILYESLNPPPRGQWRPLRVRIDQPETRIRARSGYVR